MITLEEIAPGSSLVGMEPAFVVTVAAVKDIADGAIQVVYTLPDGS